MTTYLFWPLAAAALVLICWLAYRFALERRHRRRPFVSAAARHWAGLTPPAEAPRHRVCLVGDLGAVATDGRDPVLNLLRRWMQEAGAEGTVVMLGDNVYPVGLPPVGHPLRPAAERRLDVQLSLLREFAGQVVFLSGNHDWNKGRPDGYAYLQAQEAYVRQHLPSALYLPENGCPGPVALPLAEGLMLLVLNTQWWVQRGPRPLGRAHGCSADDARQPFAQLRELLRQYPGQQMLVAGHHPLYSNAMHGGKFTVKQHVFPLTAAHKRAYLPLPILGSLFPAYRRLLGAAEDMAHPRYRRMRRRLLQVLREFPGTVYAAGHDHNLQYFLRRGVHYLVSGSGSKTAYVAAGGKATFVHERKGFFSLDYYPDGQLWLQTWEPADQQGTPAPTSFRWPLTPVPAPAPTPPAAPAPADSAG
ncbi:metallophosphoesterase [Hymenobacter jeollabukensis]|uniref:Metallophosphoesterase n=1 Tax=Hymenobacter jeollabukensis TaxID=2025313 RepID=A0A5R8WVE5_9BACT|nr:metallophosphoesterase [Hymenobacter jeollabukensis]TLM96477.1 metallophosphoesterase [Hymenobacter jeollabukensis]